MVWHLVLFSKKNFVIFYFEQCTKTFQERMLHCQKIGLEFAVRTYTHSALSNFALRSAHSAPGYNQRRVDLAFIGLKLGHIFPPIFVKYPPFLGQTVFLGSPL